MKTMTLLTQVSGRRCFSALASSMVCVAACADSRPSGGYAGTHVTGATEPANENPRHALFGASLASVPSRALGGGRGIAVGAPLARGPAGQTGAVLIVDDRTGDVIHVVYGAANESYFGETLAVVERDGDGLAPLLLVGARGGRLIALDCRGWTRSFVKTDVWRLVGIQNGRNRDHGGELVVMTTAHDQTAVACLSGTTGAALGRTFSLGKAFPMSKLIWPDLDMNHDGYRDLLIADDTRAERFRVLSGADGAALGMLDVALKGETLDGALSMISVNAGSNSDQGIVVGVVLKGTASRLLVLRGGTIDIPLQSIDHESAGANAHPGRFLDRRIVNCGDLDSDGFDEVLVLTARSSDMNSVACYSSKEGEFRWQTGRQFHRREVPTAAIADMDGDGVRDIAIGNVFFENFNSETSLGEVNVVSGASGLPIHRLVESAYAEQLWTN